MTLYWQQVWFLWLTAFMTMLLLPHTSTCPRCLTLHSFWWWLVSNLCVTLHMSCSRDWGEQHLWESDKKLIQSKQKGIQLVVRWSTDKFDFSVSYKKLGWVGSHIYVISEICKGFAFYIGTFTVADSTNYCVNQHIGKNINNYKPAHCAVIWRSIIWGILREIDGATGFSTTFG